MSKKGPDYGINFQRKMDKVEVWPI